LGTDSYIEHSFTSIVDFAKIVCTPHMTGVEQEICRIVETFAGCELGDSQRPKSKRNSVRAIAAGAVSAAQNIGGNKNRPASARGGEVYADNLGVQAVLAACLANSNSSKVEQEENQALIYSYADQYGSSASRVSQQRGTAQAASASALMKSYGSPGSAGGTATATGAGAGTGAGTTGAVFSPSLLIRKTLGGGGTDR
jgi:hypothetical protein